MRPTAATATPSAATRRVLLLGLLLLAGAVLQLATADQAGSR
ncbi:MAG: hypothetical protein ACRDU8_06700 [Egibacteraceae bacterium]